MTVKIYENVFDNQTKIENKTKEKYIEKENKNYYGLFIVKDNCVLICEDNGFFTLPTYNKITNIKEMGATLQDQGLLLNTKDNSPFYYETIISEEGKVETYYFGGNVTEEFLSNFKNYTFIDLDLVNSYLASHISLDPRRNSMDNTILNCVHAYLGKENLEEKGKLKIKEI